MFRGFTIRHAAGRTTAQIEGLPPGGQPARRPCIIPVFMPMSGCAHRCAFCNQSAITGVRPDTPTAADVVRRVEAFLRLTPRRRPVQIAFYGGNFLGHPLPLVRELLAAAAGFAARGDAVGIRFSTRPDTVSPNRLAAVGDFPVTTIELGVQSLDDRVLSLSRRGHDAACAEAAAKRVKAAGFELGLQMMTGLPGDTSRSARQTALKMIALAPDFVRIYPTLVLHRSPLAESYRNGAFVPATLQEAVGVVSRLFLLFTAAGIPVIRMGLQADPSLSADGTVLAGPYHPALGEQVHSRIFYALAAAAIERHPGRAQPLVLHVHSRHHSRLIGARRANLRRLQRRFPQRPLSVRSNGGIGPHHLEVT
jgi:histone acetyltransferase (RNA polymerase elongator complex component)